MLGILFELPFLFGNKYQFGTYRYDAAACSLVADKTSEEEARRRIFWKTTDNSNDHNDQKPREFIVHAFIIMMIHDAEEYYVMMNKSSDWKRPISTRNIIMPKGKI